MRWAETAEPPSRAITAAGAPALLRLRRLFDTLIALRVVGGAAALRSRPTRIIGERLRWTGNAI